MWANYTPDGEHVRAHTTLSKGRSRHQINPCGKGAEPTEHAGRCPVRDSDRADGHANADEDTGDYHATVWMHRRLS